MNITNITSTSFQARNANLRKADNIVRKINQEFPTISMNKFAHFYNAPNFVYKDCFATLDDKFYDEVREPLESIINNHNALDYFKIAAKTLKESPYANCSELADIAQIIFAMNGIKTYKTTLEPDIDHVCLIAHKDQSKTFKDISLECAKKDARMLHNLIVIDPWLNFADFAPNANYKYQNDFFKFLEDTIAREYDFPIELKKLPEIYFAPYFEPNLLVTPELEKKLKESFPNLILNK